VINRIKNYLLLPTVRLFKLWRRFCIDEEMPQRIELRYFLFRFCSCLSGHLL